MKFRSPFTTSVSVFLQGSGKIRLFLWLPVFVAEEGNAGFFRSLKHM